MNHFARALHTLLIAGQTLLIVYQSDHSLCIVKPIADPRAIRPASGVFIALCWAATLVFIIFSANSVKRTVKVDRRWRWGWLLPAVLVAAFLLFRHTIQLPAFLAAIILPQAVWIDILADILGLAGMVFALWGRVTLGHNWNLYPALKENHELIVRGPYQYVRHPMYTGLVSMLLGAVIWYGKAAGFAWFFACFLGTWFKLRQEEKLLTAHFGESYGLYKVRVKAIIPFIL
ncbi:MAG: isoprenylcysteine carboxylmethyltransferase family protein [Terracidiphilus sp.]|jgi:protein-S-isoprenylcysteine O-methyltransferase Ste14